MSVEQNTDLIPLAVLGVTEDPNTDTRIVILRNDATADVLPIWMGQTEGAAIRHALEDLVPPRPTSHDLMASLAAHLEITVTRVVVTDVRHNTYFAAIHLSNGVERTVDARPSDAIALALRTGCPIYVTRDVLNKSGGDNVETWLSRIAPDVGGRPNGDTDTTPRRRTGTMNRTERA